MDKDKLKSLSFPRKTGKTERKEVIDDRTGGVGGYEDVHWDGSQDAHVMPGPVATGVKVPGIKKEDES